MRRHGAWFVFIVSLSVAAPGPAYGALKPIQGEAVKQEKPLDKPPAQPQKKKDEKTVQRTVEGKVAFVRKDKISVEFASSEETGAEEMLLNLDKKVKLSGVKDFAKLKYGDEVLVKFTETYKEPKIKGEEPKILNRVGTEIKLLKPATAPKPQTNALVGVEGAPVE
jgi:hypothetical protein